MAHPDTHRSQAKSLFKRGLITQKQHDSMLTKIEKLAPAAAPASQGGAAPDPQMAAAATPAPSSQVPATVSVPGAPGSLPDPQQPPAA